MRYTEKRNGKNVIPLRNAVCGIDLPKWRIHEESDIQSLLSGDAVDHLAELEDKIEQGTLIELPCKVGDWVYTIDIGSNGKRHIEETQIAEIRVYFDGIYYQDHLGVWLFEIYLTREEAEKRLKELQG